MKELSKTWMATVFAIIGLLVGGIFVYTFIPKEIIKEVKPDNCVAVPCSAVPCTPTEVIKEIPLDVRAAYLDDAIAVFADKKLEKLTVCKTEEYDEEQIAVKTVNEDWSVVFSEDKQGNPQYSVDFGVKLKYLDKDVQEKCYKNCDVSVLYREDKSPKVVFNCD